MVEEIAIASGVPVPEIYVLEDEPAINAFAAGYTPADAAVTVTRGCLDKLTRDELQGVIAHEFSHVLNGDMRLNIRLMGVLFGILVIGIVGRKVVEGTGRSRDSGGAVAFGIAILVVGYIGVFFGRLIKAGISRQREYLADASAVQFTRQTLGIGGALKKIGGLAEGSKLASCRDRGSRAHAVRRRRRLLGAVRHASAAASSASSCSIRISIRRNSRTSRAPGRSRCRRR